MEYIQQDNVVMLHFDDGKANVVGHQFIDDMNTGLDRAERENAGAVIIRGRDGMFSAGFDLGEFKKGIEQGQAMVKRGFELLIRLTGYPLPLVTACTGHCVAMGAFVVMASDTRVATRGDFKVTLPETAISMDLPPILVALTASRIVKEHLTRVALQSEVYNPEQAVSAGFFDEVVDAEQLDSRCLELAKHLAQLPAAQYAANKLRVRDQTLKLMKDDLASMS
ncbi:crotonase/enoyl-CoA hydratase family protein [Congregibacter variabilis]|uniref:Crotonase/enoyl-CoA hydratase family protein n=1 Tax=Congregibacter variabilis TaxID=3081200 RepID=A0ABZ0I288_9GAMM|nr:crotonase/enoyl-CoA hydratase family protein [Congregibacter sp. IMCC43200]